MPTKPGGTIGSLDYTAEERQVLAKKLVAHFIKHLTNGLQ